MSVIGYYSPEGPPTMRRLQVGRFNEGQGADRGTFIGADATKIAYSVLANYLEISGRLGEFQDHVPDGLFSDEQLESVLIFGQS